MITRTINPEEINFKDKFSLTGKVIVITGGMGLIGKAFTEACLQFGSSVMIADIDKAGPEKMRINSTKGLKKEWREFQSMSAAEMM